MADENSGVSLNSSTWVVLVLAIVIGIPLFIVGTASAFKFVQFINSPIISGSVPIWVVILGVTVTILFIRKNRYG